MIKKIIGIDPGVNGAFFSLDKKVSYKIPEDKTELYNLIKSLDSKNTHFFVEKIQPRPNQSLKGVVTSCVNWGVLTAYLELCKGHIHLITPQEWQKLLKLNRRWSIPKGMSKDKFSSYKYNERKRWHKREAISLYPEVKVTLTNADAILIAEYGYRIIK